MKPGVKASQAYKVATDPYKTKQAKKKTKAEENKRCWCWCSLQRHLHQHLRLMSQQLPLVPPPLLTPPPIDATIVGLKPPMPEKIWKRISLSLSQPLYLTWLHVAPTVSSISLTVLKPPSLGLSFSLLCFYVFYFFAKPLPLLLCECVFFFSLSMEKRWRKRRRVLQGECVRVRGVYQCVMCRCIYRQRCKSGSTTPILNDINYCSFFLFFFFLFYGG